MWSRLPNLLFGQIGNLPYDIKILRLNKAADAQGKG
jgi:hypothetical protein